jgi:hypothetical protein
MALREVHDEAAHGRKGQNFLNNIILIVNHKNKCQNAKIGAEKGPVGYSTADILRGVRTGTHDSRGHGLSAPKG